MSQDQNDENEGQRLTYDESSIQVLEGLEAVRKRPAMYIGDTATAGLHHLVWEVVDNSVDEALQGRCSEITVTLHGNGSVSVLDNGAGIPTGLHQKLGVPALEVILTKLHAGGKFEKGGYQVSGGLHGVGVSVVNALSEWLEVEVYRDGKIHRQTFERGRKTSEMAILGDTDKHGTLVTWKADTEIFEVDEILTPVVTRRMREMAYLMGSYRLKITVVDERSGKSKDYFYPEGLIEYIKHLNHGKNALHDEVIHFTRNIEGSDGSGTHEVEYALQYTDAYNETILSFVNNINTIEGGTHLSGFKSALTRTINQFAKTNTLIKEKEKSPSGDDLREGLTAVISVKVPDPQFESQTKIRLGNREVESLVNSLVGDTLKVYLEENPRIGRKIFDKAMDASRAREAARKAREQVRRKSAMESSTLPGKLVDCHKGTTPEEAELFLVEGDSAGGSAVTGRAGFQAILPLRGKILNVEKAALHKIVEHREIEAIWTAVGTGFLGEEFLPEKLRYHKIIIMTDADVDGSHIRTLLLTFFYRKMPDLVRLGHVYVAQPPLYMLKKGKTQKYVHSEKELQSELLELGLKHMELDCDGKSFAGADLHELIAKLTKVRSEPGFDLASDGFNVTELVRIRRETGSWPTHYVRILSDRARKEDLSEAGGQTQDASVGEGTFILGGEEELNRVIQSLRSKDAELVLSIAGESDIDPDVLVSPVHPSERFLKAYAWFEERGIPLEAFDPKQSPDDPQMAKISIRIGGKEVELGSFSEALDRIEESGRKDIHINRFKGLGEMEAEQLWDSTMDPERRLLYQVTFEDAAEADQLFTILMGSAVEPRREFIERHALEVTNLDV